MSRKQLNKNSRKEFLRQQLKNIKDQLDEPIELNKSDLEEYLVEYEETLILEEFAENTIYKYVRNAKWFVETYVKDDEYLNKHHVLEFKKDLEENYTSAKTINNYITTINRFLHYCDLGELVVKKVKTQSENVINDRIYNHEYKRMLRRAKRIGRMDIYFIMRLMAETGIRVSERKYVTVEAINRSSLDFRVKNKGKWRTVPIPQALARDLRKYAKEKGIEEGRIITEEYRNIYNVLKSIAGHTKIKKGKVTPHSFRHYFGFRYIEINGESGLTQLADIMGHVSLETTRVYTRGTSRDLRKMMERMT